MGFNAMASNHFRLRLSRRGFTLVEILVVAAILGLLITVALPQVNRARINANEGAVRSDLRTFAAAATGFRSLQNPLAYPPNMAALTGADPPFLDISWNDAVGAEGKHGFTMTYSQLAGGNGFALIAAPLPNQALNTYCVDHTGIILMGSGGVGVNIDGCQGGSPLA